MMLALAISENHVNDIMMQTHASVSNGHQHPQSENSLLCVDHSCSSLGQIQFQHTPNHPSGLDHFQHQSKHLRRRWHLCGNIDTIKFCINSYYGCNYSCA